MVVWILSIILAAEVPAPTDVGYAEAVFSMDFTSQADLNFDGWPDNWTRRRGRGYPEYLEIHITPTLSGEDGREGHCLRIDLDGGAASVYSPPIEISSHFSYVLEGKLRTTGLDHNEAYYTLAFMDAQRRQQETFTSSRFRLADDWKNLQIGPHTPGRSDARYAVIGLHLVPTDRYDLTGSALFDDIRLSRLPRMTLTTPGENHLFSDPSEVEVNCRLSGIQQEHPELLFELLDVSGQVIASEVLALQSRGGEPSVFPVQVSEVAVDSGESPVGGFSGERTWRPDIREYGFYRVRVSLRGAGKRGLHRGLTMAVMRPSEGQGTGEFGWSVTNGEQGLGATSLVNLAGQVGINWMKYPAWYDIGDDDYADRLAWVADRLAAEDIEVVGLLDQPPGKVRHQFGDKKHLTVAEVFLEPEVWHAALDPIMVRLSLKIRYWQLGNDDDDSFIEFPELTRKVQEIRSHLRQFGQRTRLGLAWQWLHALPSTGTTTWDFVSLVESPSFTREELTGYLDDGADLHVPRWTTLRPLPASAYDVETRARDLVLRMLSAKIHQADAIFLADPFDAQTGVMNEDGSPGELLLPWTVTARAVRGAKYLGRLELPNGSQNAVFGRDDRALMVVWNDHPVKEVVYLGDEVEQIDLWGRAWTPANVTSARGNQQEITVSRQPTIVTGLNLAVTRWRLNFAFDPDRLNSVFGRSQRASYQFRNTFSGGVSGKMSLDAPDVWDLSYRVSQFKLATDESLNRGLDVSLHPDCRHRITTSPS